MSNFIGRCRAQPWLKAKVIVYHTLLCSLGTVQCITTDTSVPICFPIWAKRSLVSPVHHDRLCVIPYLNMCVGVSCGLGAMTSVMEVSHFLPCFAALTMGWEVSSVSCMSNRYRVRLVMGCDNIKQQTYRNGLGDVKNLSCRDAVPWLHCIGKPLHNQQTKRLQELIDYFQS